MKKSVILKKVSVLFYHSCLVYTSSLSLKSSTFNRKPSQIVAQQDLKHWSLAIQRINMACHRVYMIMCF